jgi:hypothetical protein
VLNNLTYQKKVQLLLLFAALFAIIAYYMAVKKTFLVYAEYKDANKKMELVENAPQKISQLEAELKKFESIIGTSDSSTKNTRQLILEKTSSYCKENNIVLKEILQPVSTEQNGYNLESNIVILEGGFSKLLNYVYIMEKNKSIGKISSVKFSINQNLLTNNKKLQSTIYIQKINKNKL